MTSKTYELTVAPRTVIGKDSKKLRRQHIMPAVLYGYGVDPTPVQVDLKEMERVYLHAGGNSLIDLTIGTGKPRKVFIHDVQRSPTTHILTHVDFVAVNLQEDITASIPIVLVGESPAVEAKEGVLLHSLDHVQVRGLPGNMPAVIEVDISSLDEVDKAIHISDLQLPPNIHVLTSADEMIAKIAALRAAEVEAEAPETAEEAGEGAEAAGDSESEEGSS